MIKLVSGVYQKVRTLWKSPKKSIKNLTKERLIKWRKEKRFVKVEKPTRIDRARSLGYKAKTGYVIVRVRLQRGGRDRPKYGKKGRKPSKTGLKQYYSKQSLQAIAEQRVAGKYPNLEVLNSYWIAKDGRYVWFETILVDPNNPQIRADRKINWIINQRRRVFRGLTAAAKKSR